MGFEVKDVEVLGGGQPGRNRREFLEQLVGMAALAVPAFGRDVVAVDGGGEQSKAWAFGQVGGFFEPRAGRIVLPTGMGWKIGPYGNPLGMPAIFHGPTLENVDFQLFNTSSLNNEIFAAMSPASRPPSERQPAHIAGLRVSQVLVKTEIDGRAGYRSWDLARQNSSPPTVTIGQQGELSIMQDGRAVVGEADGFFLSMIYQPDDRRFDSVIAVFDQTRAVPGSIVAADLQTLLLPEDKPWALQEMVETDRAHTESLPEVQDGCIFIRKGDFLWRHSMTNGQYEATCRRHERRPDEAFDEMTGRAFYEVRGGILIPEPDLRGALRLSNGSFATGLVLFGKDGSLVHRTNLTNLSKANTVALSDDGRTLSLTPKNGQGESQGFRLARVGGKPCTDGQSVEWYGVEAGGAAEAMLPRTLTPLKIGSFDLREAYRRAEALKQEVRGER